jgi:acyl carrier protein
MYGTSANAEAEVENAMHEVLGYVPQADDDLTSVIDSMQKLELLIALEQSLLVPFDDEALAADWWSSRAGIVGYVRQALANVEPA